MRRTKVSPHNQSSKRAAEIEAEIDERLRAAMDARKTNVDVIALFCRALKSIRANNEAIGGCDHAVGICNCADEQLADDIEKFLGEQQ